MKLFGNVDLRLLQLCGFSRVATRKAADLGKHEVWATYYAATSWSGTNAELRSDGLPGDCAELQYHD
jgi:hypothetical protein